MVCPLCRSVSEQFCTTNKKTYHRCVVCEGIFLDPVFLPSSIEEKKRYDWHNNDEEDSGYRNFVSPIVHEVLKNFTTHHYGLDFGSGPTPIITNMLRGEGYQITTYDPFFDLDQSVLQRSYDYIICCEVMEHFHFPENEFKLLSTILRPGGHLYCKTKLFNDQINFKDWWYKNDQTHVFFYTEKTIRWIKNHFGFKSYKNQNSVISLIK